LVVLFFIFKLIFLNTATVNVEVDKNQLRLGDPFTFTISISTALNQSAENLEIKELYADFKVLSQYQSSSFSSTFVNGKFQSSNTVHYMYVLSPKEEGLKIIPALEINIDNKVYKTKSIEINVLPSNKPTAQDEDNNTPNAFNNKKEEASNFYQFDVKAMLDKTDIYVGEQIIVSYFLISRVKLDNPDIYKRPEFTGFIKEDLETAARLNFTPQQIDGVTYNVALLSKHALYPIREGVFYVDSLGFRATVLTNDDPFGRGFFSFTRAARQETRESESIKVNVKKLPEKNRPLNFSGLVGSFTINSSLSSTDVRTGMPFSFFIKINGRGNFQAFEKPELNVSQGLELFEIKQSYNVSSLGIGEKIFEFVLIPRYEGVHEIKEYYFSFFNPNKKEYETIVLDKTIINSKGMLSLSSRVAALSNQNQQVKDQVLEDIRYIKDNFKPLNYKPYLAYSFYYFIYLALFIIFILLLYKFYFINQDKLKTELIRKTTSKYLDMAVKSSDLSTSIKYFVLAIINILAFKVDMSFNSERYDEILEAYYKSTDKKELVEEIKELINFSHNVRYKGQIKEFDKNIILKKVKKLIKSIDT